MPFDNPISVKKYLESIKPKLIVFTEIEIWWPTLISVASNKKIKMIVINGRFGEIAIKNISRYAFFTKKILSLIDLVVIQSETEKRRLKPFFKKEIIVAGNIKFDMQISNNIVKKFYNNFCWVAGSVHKKEFSAILEAHLKLLKLDKRVSLIIIPRYINEINYFKKEINRKQTKVSIFIKFKKN